METKLSKNSRGCNAHDNLFFSIKEKYSGLPSPEGMMKGIPQTSEERLPVQRMHLLMNKTLTGTIISSSQGHIQKSGHGFLKTKASFLATKSPVAHKGDQVWWQKYH